MDARVIVIQLDIGYERPKLPAKRLRDVRELCEERRVLPRVDVRDPG
jgi:hypothetical protein